MGYFALVKNGVTVSVIVADHEFIEMTGRLTLGCDLILDVSEEDPKPSPGWIYDGSSFKRND